MYMHVLPLKRQQYLVMNRYILCFVSAQFDSVARKQTDKWEILQDSELKGKTFSKQRTHSLTKPKACTVQEEFVRNPLTFPVTRGCFFFAGCCFFDVSDILRLRQTCSHANQIICMSNFLWKLLLKRDFPDKIITMNQFCQTHRQPTNFSICLNFRQNVIVHCCLTLSTSWRRREINFWRKMQSLSIN